MGAPVHDNSTLGIRAKPIRNRLKRLVKRIEENPPKGVRPGTNGGKDFVSPAGYIGQRLYTLAEYRYSEWLADNPPLGTVPPFRWKGPGNAQGFVRGLLRGGTGRHKQLDLLEALLPEIEYEVRPKPVSAVVALDAMHEAVGTGKLTEADNHRAILSDLFGNPSSEFAAAEVIAGILKPMEPETRKRVLRYVSIAFEIEEVNA